MKHRAAVAALLSLLAFLLCLIGTNMATRLAYNASHPKVDLRPLLARLQKGAGLWGQAPGGSILWQVQNHGKTVATVRALQNNVARLKRNEAANAWQAALQESLPSGREILAAVVVDPEGIIQAACPSPERLLGQGLKPPPPGKRYPVPGITTDQPTPDGYYPYLRPNDLANGPSDYWSPPPGGGYGPGTGGPYGPGGPSGGPFLAGPEDPGAQTGYMNWRLHSLLRNAKIIDGGQIETDALIEPLSNHAQGIQSVAFSPGVRIWDMRDSGVVMEQWGLSAGRRLVVDGMRPAGTRSDVPRLFVVPRPHQTAYEFATYYLGPVSVLGSLLAFLLYWCMLPWWVYLDARLRTEKAAPLALFVFLTNFLGWLTYLVIRPESDRLCPACISLLEPGFRCCPHCGWSSASRCRQCGRAQQSDWRFCPYCEAARPEVGVAAESSGSQI